MVYVFCCVSLFLEKKKIQLSIILGMFFLNDVGCLRQLGAVPHRGRPAVAHGAPNGWVLSSCLGVQNVGSPLVLQVPALLPPAPKLCGELGLTR